ncbi:hypothetical protein PghCCS26_00040 [Paenibacillus glycanilyticus]|uniref:Uncharacterized protein n=1 Tax=Paenibacillus glycanilyticus TaxID=126569 RepID=A0ABQ6NFD2_9BACL|nr:hypothetical protein [Paenibacillus glycanilyticus]GMK42877.1 hypothetical protein PghCCS26_00040 [Paenibacillus glycanilyticus]
MKKWIRQTVIAALVVSTFLVTAQSLQAESMPSVTAQQETELQSAVRGWMDELAKLPEFKAWSHAEFTVSPLGPGTHSWIAIVKDKGQPAGYLVVQAKENGGFALGEYGTGEYLFDQTTLHQSLAQLELLSSLPNTNQALYIHPLLAVWDVNGSAENTYLDGMSGEWLPLQKATLEKTAKAEEGLAARYALQGNTLIQRAVKSRSFDPYSEMPWLTEKPIPASAEDTSIVLKALSSMTPLRFTVERFNKEMLYVWSVTGYHSWGDGNVYAALETDELGSSTRYIPLKLLAELGHFYR